MPDGFTVGAKVHKMPPLQRDYSKNLVPDLVGLSSGVESKKMLPDFLFLFQLSSSNSENTLGDDEFRGFQWWEEGAISI